MTNDIASSGGLLARDADAHGPAALLLVESLLHSLIEKRLLSVAEAVEIVDVATEVKVESGTELGEPPATWQASVNLLQKVSASLMHDIVGKASRGTPA